MESPLPPGTFPSARLRAAIPIVLLGLAGLALVLAARVWRDVDAHHTRWGALTYPGVCPGTIRIRPDARERVLAELRRPLIRLNLLGPPPVPYTIQVADRIPAACPRLVDAINLGAIGASTLALAILLGRDGPRVWLSALGRRRPFGQPRWTASEATALRRRIARLGRGIAIGVALGTPGFAVWLAGGDRPPLEYAVTPLFILGVSASIGVVGARIMTAPAPRPAPASAAP